MRLVIGIILLLAIGITSVYAYEEHRTQMHSN